MTISNLEVWLQKLNADDSEDTRRKYVHFCEK